MIDHDKLRDRAGFVLDLVRPVFPAQARFRFDVNAGSTCGFHFLYWHNRKWILLPDARVSTSSLLLRVYDGLTTIIDDDASILDHPFFAGAQTVFVGVDVDGNTMWPFIDRPLSEATFALFPSAQKLVAIYFDLDSRLPCRVLKIPLCTHAIRNLSREAEVLQELRARDIRIGPESVSTGEVRYQADQPSEPRRFRYFLQDYLTGEQPGVIDMQAFVAFLDKLILPGSTITLAAIAARLKDRLDTLPINATSKGRLYTLLSSVRSDRPLPASIQHGDLSPRNLFRQPSGDYLAVDWELASRPSFGLLDLLGLRLRKNLLDKGVTSFIQIYEEHLDALEASLPVFFPGERPPLHEALALQFCQYYIDRAGSYRELAEPVLQRLDGVLASPWITQ